LSASLSWSLIPAAFFLLENPSSTFSPPSLLVLSLVVLFSFALSYLCKKLCPSDNRSRICLCLNIAVLIRSTISIVGFSGLLIGQFYYPKALGLILPDSATLIYADQLADIPADSLISTLLTSLAYGGLVATSVLAIYLVLILLSCFISGKS